MTTYRVNVHTATGNPVGIYTVQAADKDAARVEAVRAAVRNAKAYNAKYGDSLVAGGVAWALQSDTHADYVASTVRKSARQAVAR